MAGTTPPAGTGSLYAQIAADLREKIQNGTIGPGALLPGRKQIAAIYGVSQITGQNALVQLSREGYARAIKGRGFVARRKRPPLTVPGWLYATPAADGSFLGGGMLDLHQLDVYQEIAPGHIAAPLGSGEDLVWVRRAVHSAADDPEPVQIHHSWLTGLGDDAETALCAHDPAMSWPGAVQQVTGRTIHTVAAAHPSPRRQPLRGHHLRDPRQRRRAGQPPHHLRRRPPAHRALPIRLARRRRPDQHRIQLPRRPPPATLTRPDAATFRVFHYDDVTQGLRTIRDGERVRFLPARPTPATPPTSSSSACLTFSSCTRDRQAALHPGAAGARPPICGNGQISCRP